MDSKQAFNDRCCVPVSGSSHTEALCHKPLQQQFRINGSTTKRLMLSDPHRTAFSVSKA
jgi:hypothetical protein